MPPAQPLTPEERHGLLEVLARAARDVYPGLGLALPTAFNAATSGDFCAPGRLASLAPHLPRDVTTAWELTSEQCEEQMGGWLGFGQQTDAGDGGACEDPLELARDAIAHRRLDVYLFHDDRNNERARVWLDGDIGSMLEHFSRLDRDSFRSLWSGIVHRARVTPGELLVWLAKDVADESESGCCAPYPDLLVLEYQFDRVALEQLSPSERFADGQALRLAADNLVSVRGHLADWHNLLWYGLRIGDFAFARELITRHVGSSWQADQVACLCLADTLSQHVEGVAFFLGRFLPPYLEVLTARERAHFVTRYNFEAVPTPDDLRALIGEGAKRQSGMKALHLGMAAAEYSHNSHARTPPLAPPLFRLLPALFYIDPAGADRGVVEQLLGHVTRGILYWRIEELHERRASAGQLSNEKLNRLSVLHEVISVWHTHSENPSELRSCAETLLASESLRDLVTAAREPSAVRARHCLLPVRLLQVRALRLLGGRGSPEWLRANQLAEDHFGAVLYPELLEQNWNGDPGLVLLHLEALRQLGIARSESAGPDDFCDGEVGRIASQLLIRLEMVDDPSVRRRLSELFRPAVTALAGWEAARGRPENGLCLFEMSRSRWLVDNLALSSRTLVVTAADDQVVRTYKDRLFEALNPVLGPGEPIVPRSVPDALLSEKNANRPDLARLVAANWLFPDEVRRLLESDLVLLAYHVEDDPAAAPLIRLEGSDQPGRGPGRPGESTRLWMFHGSTARIDACICDWDAGHLHDRIWALWNANLDRVEWVGYGQPGYNWTDTAAVRHYHAELEKFGKVLLAPLREESWSRTSPRALLIIPSAELFRLPWPAVPLSGGRCLLDATVPGVMPGLGLAVWLSRTGPRERGSGRVEVFLQRFPDAPAGLQLPDEFVARLRTHPVVVVEGEEATPSRLVTSFGSCECLILLCHGLHSAAPALQLSPGPAGESGQLTVHQLEAMAPADRTRVVFLGACWTGLTPEFAADDTGGLAKVLFEKGVEAVAAGLGLVPLDLLAAVTDRLIPVVTSPSRRADIATAVREAQLALRQSLLDPGRRVLPNEVHPTAWASLLFYGMPRVTSET
jgi:hypothetical protein